MLLFTLMLNTSLKETTVPKLKNTEYGNNGEVTGRPMQNKTALKRCIISYSEKLWGCGTVTNLIQAMTCHTMHIRRNAGYAQPWH